MPQITIQIVQGKKEKPQKDEQHFCIGQTGKKYGRSSLRGPSAGHVWDDGSVVHWSQDGLLFVQAK